MWKKSIIWDSPASISENCFFWVFSRDTDSYTMMITFWAEHIHIPVFSKIEPSFFEDSTYFIFSKSIFFCNHDALRWSKKSQLQWDLFFCFIFYRFCFFLRNDVKFWISLWRFESDRIAWCQFMATLLTTTTQYIATICSKSTCEKTVFSETTTLFEFS